LYIKTCVKLTDIHIKLLRSKSNSIFDETYKEFFDKQNQYERQYEILKLQNAYQLFKLESSSSTEEIKSKYRELAIKWHPDELLTTLKM